MSFVQVIEYKTDDLDAIKRVNEEWKNATEGKRTAKRLLLGKYRNEEDRVCEIVFFDSYEDAMRNNELPETQQYARKLRDVTQDEPTYFDLEVLEEETL